MDEGKINDSNNSQMQFIEALNREALMMILLDLCKDSNVAERISLMAKAALSDVDADEIADEVFANLNSIQVEELWDNSGKSYGGYQDPTDIAFEMIENEVRHHIRKMEQYKSLGMKLEEKEYCKGIIIGLLRYGEAGNNEFRDWCPDDPYTVAENIIYDWENDHTIDEIEEVQAVYDSFFADDETD